MKNTKKNSKEQFEILLIEVIDEDAKFIQQILKEASDVKFKLTHTVSLNKGLILFKKKAFDLILLNLDLPDSQGIDTIKQIHSLASEIPIVVLSHIIDEQLAINVVREGAQDYLLKKHLTSNMLSRVIRYAIGRIRAEEKIKKSFEKLRKTLEGTVNALAATSEMRDPYTAGHQQRVALLASAIAKELDLPEEHAQGIRVAAILHDIGKIYVPSEILNKPGQLTSIEMGLIKTHPQVGFEILKAIDFPWPVAKIVQQHQERINGSGYPQGLKENDILLEAKILCVADVVEAMASHRPYRAALGIEKALNEIEKNKGVLYDSKIVDICIKLFKEKNFNFT